MFCPVLCLIVVFLVDPALHCDHLILEKGNGYILFSLVCGIYTVCYDWFALPQSAFYVNLYRAVIGPSG